MIAVIILTLNAYHSTSRTNLFTYVLTDMHKCHWTVLLITFIWRPLPQKHLIIKQIELFLDKNAKCHNRQGQCKNIKGMLTSWGMTNNWHNVLLRWTTLAKGRLRPVKTDRHLGLNSSAAHYLIIPHSSSLFLCKVHWRMAWKLWSV